jgi:hypothetical protein
MTLILHQTSSECIENDCLDKLFVFFKRFGLIPVHKFMQINMDTPNIVYYIFS